MAPRLKKDALTDLTAEELGVLAGASGTSCSPLMCVTDPCSNIDQCITGRRCIPEPGPTLDTTCVDVSPTVGC